MPDIKNCPECGRLFADVGNNVCNKCLEKEDSEFAIVRRYVRDNPGASIFEVAEETGISEEKILQFLKDGRLQSAGFVEVSSCEGCGKKIAAGRYCDKCLSQLGSELRSVMPKAGLVPKADQLRGKDKMYVRGLEKNPKS